MILLLGALGQLGRDLFPLLPEPKLAWSRADLNLDDFAATREKIAAVKPSVVVNCTAYNFVDRAESEPETAFRTNAWAIRNLAEVCRDLGTQLVHFSTDYVFGLDPTRQQPWHVEDAPGPISIYGLSKLSGEYLVRSTCPEHLVIRTCGLYGLWGVGGKGGNFVETMLKVAAQGKPLRVVNDQRCTPSMTLDVARTACELIAKRATGLYHVTNSGEMSWYEFAEQIFKFAKVSASLTPIPTSGYPLPARRPAYSVLALDKLATVAVSRPRPWQEAIEEYLQLREKRS